MCDSFIPVWRDMDQTDMVNLSIPSIEEYNHDVYT